MINMEEINKKNNSQLEKDIIILRNFSKGIFFLPLFVLSILFLIIQVFLEELNPWLGGIWVVIFFSNFSVTVLDFPSYRVLVLILITVIVVLLVIFFSLIPTLEQEGVLGEDFNLGLPAEFYMIMTIILGLILGLIFITTRFDYYKIERNEVYHKKGIFSLSTERFPVRGLRIKKEIPDLFEYMMLKAGTISMIWKNKIVILNTVLNVKKKIEQIDDLLSHLQVAVD